jgi:hypothetical protein
VLVEVHVALGDAWLLVERPGCHRNYATSFRDC